ncbi:hypothetical protein BDZ88DRAFT_424179 [Geranomyces variabilis]|nr:hypothetical protein BDZ88DRAFT_424179 [Geranomyces variabilis]KAJ3136008.1 hypothetical protein HDU90_003410 [Geranomyces variabilis]
MSAPAISGFGLIGSFPNDRPRISKAQQLCQQLQQGASTSGVTTAQVREVLSQLPQGGRIELCAKNLLSSDMPAEVRQQNGELVLQLFRECFDAIVSSAFNSENSVTTATQVGAADATSAGREVDEWVIINLSIDQSVTAAGSQAGSAAAPVNTLLYLKTSQYYVLRALVSSLHSFGPLAVTLFDEYASRTTSTVFRGQFIKAMVSLPASLFSDERLERLYYSSVEAMRRLIESTSWKLGGPRASFISRLIAAGDTSAQKDLVHFATPEILERRFLKAVQVADEVNHSAYKVLSVVDAEWSFKLNWPLHGQIYLRFLTVNLSAHASDPLWCGCFLDDFHAPLLKAKARPPGPDVALQLFNLYQTYAPLAVEPRVHDLIKQQLFHLSRTGELAATNQALAASAATRGETSDGIAYEGLCHVVPPMLYVRALSSEDKQRLFKQLVLRTPDGFAFSALHVELAKVLLNELKRKYRHCQLIIDMTLEVLSALSSRAFYQILFDTTRNVGDSNLVAETLRSFLPVAFALNDHRCSQPILKAWLNLHLSHTPDDFLASKDTEEKNQRSGGGIADAAAAPWDLPDPRSAQNLWRPWRASVSAPILQHLAAVAEKAVSVVNACTVRTMRSEITCYVGYAAVLAGQLFEVFESCAASTDALQLFQACMPVLDLLAPLLNSTDLAPLYPAIAEDASSSPSEPGLRSIAAARAIGDRFVSLIVSSMQRRMQFDPTSPQYATLSASSLAPKLMQLATAKYLGSFPALGPALFSFCTYLLDASKLPQEVTSEKFVSVPPRKKARKLSKEASLSFILVPPTSEGKKSTWVRVDADYHREYSALALGVLRALGEHAKQISALEGIAQQAWKVMCTCYFPGCTVPNSTDALKSNPLEDLFTFQRFRDALRQLPSSVVETEKPLLHSALVYHLRCKKFNDAAVNNFPGWWSFLLSAVDACGADWPARNSWLRKIRDVSLPPVRALLRQETHSREPEQRLAAYLELLRVSSETSWREFARTLEFVQRRTKNEAGLYRRDIYGLIGESFPDMLTQSLRDAGASGEEHSFSSVQVMTDALVQILRDDLSTRDSVAKCSFKSLARSVITNAIAHVGPPLLSIRRAWLTCGLTMDMMLLRAQGGEDAVRTYVWPIEKRVFSRQNSVTEEVLNGQLQVAVLNGVKGGKEIFASLRQKAYRTERHVHVAPEELYTPEQAVELLCSTIMAQRQQQADEAPVRAVDFLVDGVFFPPAEEEIGAAAAATLTTTPRAYKSITLRCIERLIAFCGVRWTSVPTLVFFFDQVVSTVADSSLASHTLFPAHFNQTYALFNTVRGLYPPEAAWYELAPLSQACSTLFASAVHRCAGFEARALRTLWTQMYLHKGKIGTLSSLALPEIGYLVANVVPLRHAPTLSGRPNATKSQRILADKADTIERAATMFRDLLALSPSAIHEVWCDLLGIRDDILSSYLGKTRGELFGVFDEQMKVSGESDGSSTNVAMLPPKLAAEDVFFPLTSAQLATLSATAMQTFTQQLMQRAMNQKLAPAMRSEAITQFVQSPAASHLDVIALLRKLHALIAQRTKRQAEKDAKEKQATEGGQSQTTGTSPRQLGDTTVADTPAAAGALAQRSNPVKEDLPVDNAVDLLLESVILRVFDTDATWFVLAFLLDPNTIASAPQRTTAKILTNLNLWAPVDRTVAVLRVLLEPRRRWAIRFFLHKQIMRTLFECSGKSPVARDLFLSEWQQRNRVGTEMPTDVRHDVVSMAVNTINGRPDTQALVWTVFEDLVAEAETREVDEDVLLLLFKPMRYSAQISDLLRNTAPKGWEDPQSFGHFHLKLQNVGTGPFDATRETRKRMETLMNKLSAVCRNPFVRVVAQLQQFLFCDAVEGIPDDESIERLHQMLVQAITVEDATEQMSLDAAVPDALPRRVALDETSEWQLSVIPRLYASLSLQVLLQVLESAPEGQKESCASLCARHPHAIRLRETVNVLLQMLLNTPPAHAERRVRVAKACTGLMQQVSQMRLPQASSLGSERTSWSVELIQAPFKDLLDFLRYDLDLCAKLPHGVAKS